jgi:hypothetical protein
VRLENQYTSADGQREQLGVLSYLVTYRSVFSGAVPRDLDPLAETEQGNVDVVLHPQKQTDSIILKRMQ